MFSLTFATRRQGSHRSAARTAALVCLMLGLGTLSGCLDLLKPRQRRFGSTCGVSAECAGGVCYHGHCTTSCSTAAQCGSGVCLDKVCQAADDDYDLDGLANTYEAKHKLDPAKVDSDGDGIADGIEVGADQAHPKDTNGDGIIDALQSNTADTDGDCIGDAYDKLPAKPDPLPAADKICPFGVCKDNIAQMKVICSTGPATARGTAAGCPKCQCDGAEVGDWQAVESFCDAKDNDCDGATDKGLKYNGLPLGAACSALQGACQGMTVAGPALGVVECGTDKAITCSTAANGSKSLAKPESCNLIDDDCDGVTDNGFTLGGIAVGKPCGTCDFAPATCQDGAPANPAVVTCTADGTAALCSGIPFAPGFQTLLDGAPQPRAAWTAEFVADWKRVVLYGGAVPGAGGLVDRDDQWTLSTVAAGKNLSQPTAWQRSNGNLPGRRSRAALVWEPLGSHLILVGGEVDGQPTADVKQLDGAGQWLDLSALPTTDAKHIAPLSSTHAVPVLDPTASAHGVTLLLNSGDEALVAMLPGDATPVWTTVQGNMPWQEVVDLTGSMPGEVACVARSQSGTFAIAVTAGGLFRIGQNSANGVSVEPLETTGSANYAPFGLQCVLDAKDALHIFGGHDAANNVGAYFVGTFAGNAASATSIDVKYASDPTGNEAAMNRSGGFAAWDATNQAIVLGGGVRFEGPTGNRHAIGLTDVWFLPPQVNAAQRLDAPAPEGRIGEASGWSQTHKAFCLAGGLAFGLPDGPGLPVRVQPATDAWCMDAAGAWQRLAGTIAPFAFGISAVDQAGDRLVLGGGVDLAVGQTVTDVGRLWRGELMSGGVLDPAWHPSTAVQTIALATGVVTQAPAMPVKAATIAPAQALDPVRNRVLWFGGIGADKETQTFYSLHLSDLSWVDLHPEPIAKTENVPQPRYGALALYDAYRDVFALTAGFIRYLDGAGSPGGAGLDTFPGGSDPCYGPIYGALWAATTGVAPIKPTFQSFPLPSFATTTPSASQPLLRPFFGGPAFLPVLYDALGGHGWLAVPQSNIKGQFYAANTCTTIPDEVDFATTDIQVTLDVGMCGSAQPIAASVKTVALQNAPSTLLLAVATYIEADRRSMLWGGLDTDYTPSAVGWRLDQSCQ